MANIAPLLGKSDLLNGYRVEFYKQDQNVVVEIYQIDRKIGECILDGLPVDSWTYPTLPDLARSKINQFLNTHAGIEPERVSLEESDREDLQITEMLLGHDPEEDSDMELEEPDPRSLIVFERQAHFQPASTTISCLDGNIKGGELIANVHDLIKRIWEDVIDLACQYEKNLGGAQIPPPEEENGVLYIQEPREWFMSLGGWKGMMPREEVKGYFFYDFFQQTKGKKFDGVEIFGNGVVFPLKNHRIHLRKGFSINQVNVTDTFEKREKWIKIPSGRTDLSYSQIVRAIKAIKNGFNVDDSEIAALQLYALNYEMSLPDWFEKKIPEKNRKEILVFLDYLNGLMFGIEASGLNAALATGLMTLDLIVNRCFDYQQAFKANDDGGIYPYACFGNNSGTYSQREKVLTQGEHDPYSMKTFRENPFLSPVALKEVILIIKWLKFKGVIQKMAHSEQIEKIKEAIGTLVHSCFFPQ